MESMLRSCDVQSAVPPCCAGGSTQGDQIVKTISYGACVDNNRLCDILNVLALTPKRIGTPRWIDSEGREMEAIGKLGAIGIYIHRQ